MPTLVDNLEPQLLMPSEAEQSQLADRMMQNLDEVVELGVEEAWMREVYDRAKQLSSGEVSAVPWEVVRCSILEDLNEAD